MREFDHPNFHNGFRCPICNTSVDKPVVLRPIPGTKDDGKEEAEQVHATCFYHATYNPISAGDSNSG